MNIGIDIGRVIIGGEGPNDTSFFTSNYLLTPSVKGSFDAVAHLVHLNEPENVFLVSKCGHQVRKKTLHWLEHHDFFALTGLLPDNIHFCKEHAEKAVIAEKLKLEHFIDDRWSVLKHMQGLVPNLSLFGPQKRNTWNHIPLKKEEVIDVHAGVIGHYPTWQRLLELSNLS